MKVETRLLWTAGAVLWTALGASPLACNAIDSIPDPGTSQGNGHDGGGAVGTADATVPADAAPDDGGPADDGAMPSPEDSGSDAATCNSVTVSLATDPENCGACGHSCLGGGCQNGTCQPTRLVQGAAGALGIAVDDTNVYYSQFNGGCLSKVPKNGGAVELMSAGQGNPWMVASDNKNVYWTDRSHSIDYLPTSSGLPGFPATDGGSVGQCGMLDGGLVGDVQTLANTATGAAPYGIATDGTNVYWTDLFVTGSVWSTPIAGSHPSAPHLLSAGPCNGYCQTGIGAYQSDAGPGVVWLTYAGYVYHTSVTSGETAQLTRFINSDSRFVVSDGINVYWTISDGSSVWTVPLAGGEAVAISQSEGTPWGIAVDPSGVYWVDSATPTPGMTGNAVRRARFTNGEWVVVTMVDTASEPGIETPMGVATDANAIYWAENGSGRVMKMAK